MNNNLYSYKYETKPSMVNRREELILTSPVGRDYIRKKLYIYTYANNSNSNFSQAKKHLDTKAYLYLCDSKFYDHEQAQIVSAEVDLKNKIVVVSCIPNVDMDINEFCKDSKLNVHTKGYKMMQNKKILELKCFFSRKLI